MNILIKDSMKAVYNALWSKVKGSWVAPYMSCEQHGLSAWHLLKQFTPQDQAGHALARGLFDRPLHGAADGWGARYPLPYDATATIPVVVSSTNSADVHVLDNCTALEIGHCWVVAGTVTALVMDFDRYTGAADGVGTATDKLDGTNGVITAPTVAGQAIGNVLYKDLGATLGGIDLTKGNSVRAIVTTTCTAGSGVPYVLVVPRAESAANISTMIASS